MSPTTRFPLAAVLMLAGLTGLARAAEPPKQTAETAPSYRISGPFTHDNLTIFFLHGKDQIKDKKILSLDEALKDKKLIVHETKNVQQLAVENVSTEPVFIQAGDLVKGGQQDRIIALDLLVPPKSGKVLVGSFCVEANRWQKRGKEDVDKFNRSGDALVNNDLKRAARATGGAAGMRGGAQQRVWSGVSKAQMQLEGNLKTKVKAAASESSLGLTLEHKKLLEAVETYSKKLQGSLDKQTDVIGFAVAINGKVNNADVYANAELFRKLWPKLLKCSAVEAIAEKKDKLKVEPVKPEAVTTFLAEAAKGKKTEKKLIQELVEVQCDAKNNILFTTRTKEGAILRSSYVGK
jgi:hypothetical protein